MFNKYKELIEKLFNSVFKSTEQTTFLDYLNVLKYTALILLNIILVVSLFVGMITIPVLLYKKFVSSIKKIDSKELSLDDFNKLEKKIFIRNILYWTALIFLYLPFLIPTILYIISKIIR